MVKIVLQIFLALVLTTPWVAHALPNAAGHSAALAAAAGLCPAVNPITEEGFDGFQLAEDVQTLVTAQSCFATARRDRLSSKRLHFFSLLAILRTPVLFHTLSFNPQVSLQALSDTACPAWGAAWSAAQLEQLAGHTSDFCSLYAGTAEVQQAVKAAALHNLTLAVKGGGYS